MKILVSGSRGLVGSALVPFLTAQGHQVVRLRRGGAVVDQGAARWDPATGAIDESACADADAVVHLAGENLAAGRWTAERKRRILSSRADVTKRLCETLARMTQPPHVLVSASAVGYYGSRGDELLDESSNGGSGFLADVCRAWEEATRPASAAGIRTVNLRLGMVLSGRGGALARMLLPFRIGLGGAMGSGRQYVSWIAIDDLVSIIHHVIAAEELSGPVNAVAPEPLTNREFARTLARVLRRPAVVTIPAFALRLLFGEMAGGVLLSSTRVVPERLLNSGYIFQHRDLESALAGC